MIAYQQAKGLAVDGIAGPQTLAAIQSNAAVRDDQSAPVATLVEPLERGDESDEVVRLQDRLKELGYFNANQRSTGFYGSITVDAVIDFQRKNGLAANGIASPETLAAIQSNGAVRADQIRLAFGSEGTEVVKLQDRLKVLGDFPSDTTSTGRYGRITQDAVRKFQRRHSLPNNGVAGPDTLAILYDDSRAVSAAPTPEPDIALQFSSLGEGVVRLKNRLKELNYLPATASSDDFYGIETERAVIAFQRDYGLNPDGIAGKVTQDILYSAIPVAASNVASAGQVMQVATQGAELMVREGPSANTRVIDLLVNGASIKTTGQKSNGWIELESGGWVFGDWVK